MGGYGLSFVVGGAGAGMDDRRAKDIQDDEIKHTKERRAIVEPLQDRALGLGVQNAENEAKYRAEDRPLERKAKEQATEAGGLQLDASKKKLPLELEAQRLQNKVLGISANLQQLHANQYTEESGIKSMDLRGQRAYGIAKLADMNPSLALDAFNNMPETKASGVQAAWIGYDVNPNDPKDKEKYLVAKDADGKVINFKGPGGKPLPAMYKKSALDVYAPKFDQWDVKDGVMFNKYSGATGPGGVGGLGSKASEESRKRAYSAWGQAGMNGEISFNGDNGKYAAINASLTDQLRKANPGLDANDAHMQALAMTQAMKKRDEFQGELPSNPNKAAAALKTLFPYGGMEDQATVRDFMGQHGIDQKADQDAILAQLGQAANAAADAPAGKKGNTSYRKAPRPQGMSNADLVGQAKMSTAYINNPDAVRQNLIDWGVTPDELDKAGI